MKLEELTIAQKSAAENYVNVMRALAFAKLLKTLGTDCNSDLDVLEAVARAARNALREHFTPEPSPYEVFAAFASDSTTDYVNLFVRFIRASDLKLPPVTAAAFRDMQEAECVAYMLANGLEVRETPAALLAKVRGAAGEKALSIDQDFFDKLYQTIPPSRPEVTDFVTIAHILERVIEQAEGLPRWRERRIAYVKAFVGKVLKQYYMLPTEDVEQLNGVLEFIRRKESLMAKAREEQRGR
jgi:hypothetical protein